MVHNTAQAAGAATAGVERALGILGQGATLKSVKEAVAVLGRVLDDMRTVCINLTGDEEAQESIGHGAGTVRYGRTKRSNAHKDTAGAPDVLGMADCGMLPSGSFTWESTTSRCIIARTERT